MTSINSGIARISAFAAAATAPLLTPAVAVAQGYYMHDGGMGSGWGGGWGHGIFGTLIMLLLLAAVVVAVVLIVRWAGGGPREGGESRALDILKERFARGEIDKDEFEERRRLL